MARTRALLADRPAPARQPARPVRPVRPAYGADGGYYVEGGCSDSDGFGGHVGDDSHDGGHDGGYAGGYGGYDGGYDPEVYDSLSADISAEEDAAGRGDGAGVESLEAAAAAAEARAGPGLPWSANSAENWPNSAADAIGGNGYFVRAEGGASEVVIQEDTHPDGKVQIC